MLGRSTSAKITRVMDKYGETLMCPNITGKYQQKIMTGKDKMY